MGFEAFELAFVPKRRFSTSVADLVRDIHAAWPGLAPDPVESSRWPASKAGSPTFLVHESPQGLFQAIVRPGASNGEAWSLSVRFAYANPESVQEPFFEFAEWAMERYDLGCLILASDDPRTDEGRDRIETPSDLRRVAVPLIASNRRLWHADVETDEQAALRPDDALKRFFGPRMGLEEEA